MTKLRPAHTEDFEIVLPLFSRFAEPRPSEDLFRRIFETRWNNPFGFIGHLLEDGGRAVGFLGAIFSLRQLRDGSERQFCNLTSWVVEPEYRSESLRLLFPLLQLRDVTLTNLSGNKVAEILGKFGFEQIDRYYQLVFPLPWFARKSQIITDPNQLGNTLQGVSKKVFEDHLGLFTHHILLRNKTGDCYLMADVTRKKGRRVLQIHFASNACLLKRVLPVSATELCRAFKTVAILVGEHLLENGKYPLALTIPQRQARLFRGVNVGRMQMDTAYSELQLLGILSEW